MSIVSSTSIVDAHTQPDGSRYVHERHTDSEGVVHQIGPYLAPPGYDTAARLAADAVVLADRLAEAEAAALAGDGA